MSHLPDAEEASLPRYDENKYQESETEAQDQQGSLSERRDNPQHENLQPEYPVRVIVEGLGIPATDVEAPSPEALWQCLVEQIGSWHFKPDLQAVQILLAFEASYQISTEDHLWLHLIGPSSSGKTSLGIAMIDGLFTDHHQLGEITPNTFLSGLTRGKQKGKLNSFLHQIGDRGLIYAPDFTNFLSNDHLTVGKIAGQLREIYDGKMTKRAGSMEHVNEWSGNVAMITAFTPSVESKWHSHNREGERFLTLRWHGAEAVGETEERRLGGLMKLNGKKDRQEELREIVRELILQGGEENVIDEQGKPRAVLHGLTNPGTTNIQDRSFRLARLVGKLRTLPVRSDGKNISHVAGEESPGRVFKQLIKVARGWASLMRRDEVLQSDWALAERLAIDTIPETRRWLLESLPWGSGSAVTRVELLQEMTPFQGKEAVEWHLADLKALGVVGVNGAGEVFLKDKFVALAEAGCPGWVAGLQVGYEEKVLEAQDRIESKEFGVVR